MSAAKHLCANRHRHVLIATAVLVCWIGAIDLHLQSDTRALTARSPVVAVLVWSAIGLGLHGWLRRSQSNYDPVLLPCVMLLAGLGLLVIARVASNFLARQLIWLCVSATLFAIIVYVRNPLRWLRRFKYMWLLFALALLALTLIFGVNPSGAGARLWLGIGGIFLQPSELLRLFMLAFLAAFLAERAEVSHWRLELTLKSLITGLQILAPSAAMWLVSIVLLFSQQDLGAAVLLLGTFVSMLYLASGRRRLPLIGLAALVIAGLAGYLTSARVAQRIDIWLNPWLDPQNASFQIVQSLIAVANGGLFGRGLGRGQPDYVPAVHTDFPYAAICEELGLVGAIVVIGLFSTLVLRAWQIARQSKSAYAQLLAGGIAVSMTLQIFVIVGGNLGLVPLTGVTLPFISYGGSSLLVQFVSIGLLLRVKSDANDGSPYPARNAASAQTLKWLCAALFAVLALATSYWSVVMADVLVQRNDNLRRISQPN